MISAASKNSSTTLVNDENSFINFCVAMENEAFRMTNKSLEATNHEIDESIMNYSFRQNLSDQNTIDKQLLTINAKEENNVKNDYAVQNKESLPIMKSGTLQENEDHKKYIEKFLPWKTIQHYLPSAKQKDSPEFKFIPESLPKATSPQNVSKTHVQSRCLFYNSIFANNQGDTKNSSSQSGIQAYSKRPTSNKRKCHHRCIRSDKHTAPFLKTQGFYINQSLLMAQPLIHSPKFAKIQVSKHTPKFQKVMINTPLSEDSFHPTIFSPTESSSTIDADEGVVNSNIVILNTSPRSLPPPMIMQQEMEFYKNSNVQKGNASWGSKIFASAEFNMKDVKLKLDTPEAMSSQKGDEGFSTLKSDIPFLLSRSPEVQYRESDRLRSDEIRRCRNKMRHRILDDNFSSKENEIIGKDEKFCTNKRKSDYNDLCDSRIRERPNGQKHFQLECEYNNSCKCLPNNTAPVFDNPFSIESHKGHLFDVIEEGSNRYEIIGTATGQKEKQDYLAIPQSIEINSKSELCLLRENKFRSDAFSDVMKFNAQQLPYVKSNLRINKVKRPDPPKSSGAVKNPSTPKRRYRNTLKKHFEGGGGSIHCTCRKSKCLKLYCVCFQQGAFCNRRCRCADCKNTKEYEGYTSERTIIMERIKRRRPGAFEKATNHNIFGCACKKNHCLKKYCSCFSKRISCDERKCTCNNCHNMFSNEKGNSALLEEM